jgi:hypothetical protein
MASKRRANLAAYYGRRLDEENRSYKALTGRDVDPDEGYCQVRPEGWTQEARAASVRSGGYDNQSTLIQASFHYGQWCCLKHLLDELGPRGGA